MNQQVFHSKLKSYAEAQRKAMRLKSHIANTKKDLDLNNQEPTDNELAIHFLDSEFEANFKILNIRKYITT